MYFWLLHQIPDRCLQVCELDFIWETQNNIQALCQKTGSVYFCSSVVQLEIDNGETSRSYFVFQNCFSSPGFYFWGFVVCFVLLWFLLFSYEAKNSSFKSFEELCWDCCGDYIAYLDNFFQKHHFLSYYSYRAGSMRDLSDF